MVGCLHIVREVLTSGALPEQTMAKPSQQEQHQLLNSEIQDLDTPLRSTVTAPQPSTSRHRPGYARAPSVSFVDDRLLKSAMVDSTDDISLAPRTPSPSGLGIRVGEGTPPKISQAMSSSIRRVPVGGGVRQGQ